MFRPSVVGSSVPAMDAAFYADNSQTGKRHDWVSPQKESSSDISLVSVGSVDSTTNAAYYDVNGQSKKTHDWVPPQDESPSNTSSVGIAGTIPTMDAAFYSGDTSKKRTLGSNSSSGIRSETRLPRELRDMFGPLTCKLCDATATSTMTAKTHYEGKPHEKKVRKYLEKWSEETGEPMPKLSKPSAPEIRQDATYCSTCEIVLTSVTVAQQHYMGKPHMKALRGFLTKKKKGPAAQIIAEDSRFGIGSAFVKAKEIETEITMSEPLKKNRWSCDLCGVLAHSEDQLMMHMKGTKHLKATKKVLTPSVIPAPANPSESILASVFHPNDKGNYYCRPCNVTLNSSEQFNQHVESKKHKFKFSSVKKPVFRNERVEH